MDGSKQREALNAASRAIDLLGADDSDAARVAAFRAADLDQIGLYRQLPAAVEAVAADPRSGAAWDALVVAVGEGPLAEKVAGVRTDG